MVALIAGCAVAAIFMAGFASGFFVRDRKSRRRREAARFGRYLHAGRPKASQSAESALHGRDRTRRAERQPA